MKAFLLDANSIMRLTRAGWMPSEVDGIAFSTTGIATYELGNAVWKDLHLFKKLSNDDARVLLAAFHETLLRLNVERQEELNERLDVLGNADQYGLSYYDSSYLTAAMHLDATLVTEDKSLRNAAKAANLSVFSANDLMNT